MNYLAHLYFSKPEKMSLTGNLMGDFLKGTDTRTLPESILKGIENHRLVDKFTDQHNEVKSLKQHLSPERKRFSAVISDVVFDHFLARHWQKFSTQPFEAFVEHSYRQLGQSRDYMPERMQLVIARMIKDDWLTSYHSLDNIGHALNGISRRIRFENQLHGAIDEVQIHYQHYERVFQRFFPELCQHVALHAIESK